MVGVGAGGRRFLVTWTKLRCLPSVSVHKVCCFAKKKFFFKKKKLLHKIEKKSSIETGLELEKQRERVGSKKKT